MVALKMSAFCDCGLSIVCVPDANTDGGPL